MSSSSHAQKNLGFTAVPSASSIPGDLSLNGSARETLRPVGAQGDNILNVILSEAKNLRTEEPVQGLTREGFSPSRSMLLTRVSVF
jgi:hypothetical protein